MPTQFSVSRLIDAADNVAVFAWNLQLRRKTKQRAECYDLNSRFEIVVRSIAGFERFMSDQMP